MQFNSLSEFFAMGGYAFYVWLSFGVSALLLLGLIWLSKQQHQQTLTAIALQQKRHEKLRQARDQRAKNKLEKIDNKKGVSQNNADNDIEKSQSNSANINSEVSDESTS